MQSDEIIWQEISTSSTYTITSSDQGKYIQAVVDYTDDEGHQESFVTNSSFVISEKNFLYGIIMLFF